MRKVMVKQFLCLASSSLSDDHKHVTKGKETKEAFSFILILTLWGTVPNNRCTCTLRGRTGCVSCVHRGDLCKQHSGSRRVARSEKRPWRRGNDAAYQNIESQQHHCSLTTHLYCVCLHPFASYCHKASGGGVVVYAGALTPAKVI